MQMYLQHNNRMDAPRHIYQNTSWKTENTTSYLVKFYLLLAKIYKKQAVYSDAITTCTCSYVVIYSIQHQNNITDELY